MPRFISQVLIIVEADNVTDACDAMSGCLSETLKYDGHIVDWSYVKRPGFRIGTDGYDLPKLIAEPHQSMPDIEDEDFDAMNAGATRDEVAA
jgi:hypothetical protein